MAREQCFNQQQVWDCVWEQWAISNKSDRMPESNVQWAVSLTDGQRAMCSESDSWSESNVQWVWQMAREQCAASPTDGQRAMCSKSDRWPESYVQWAASLTDGQRAVCSESERWPSCDVCWIQSSAVICRHPKHENLRDCKNLSHSNSKHQKYVALSTECMQQIWWSLQDL